MKRLPVRARGGKIVYALVDDEDFASLRQRSWIVTPLGYVAVTGRAGATLHRLVLGLRPGDGLDGDHINRNRLDNRRANLRALPRRLALQNRSVRRDARSGRRGVTWDESRKKWRANVTVEGRTYFLGRFTSLNEAADVASKARARLSPYSEEALNAP